VTFWSSNGLTGQSAFYGKGSLLAQQLLAKKINSAGGFTDHKGNTYMIELKTWDDADTPAQSVAGMQKAASDSSILGMIGSTSDVAWLPEVPVAGQLKLPLIIPSDGSNVAASKWNPYSFRVFGSEEAWFKVAIDILAKHVKPKRIAALYDITQQSQAFDASLWKKYAPSIGAQMVAFESLRVGDTDFRPQLTKMKAANPDFLVFDASEPSGIFNQAVELGLLPKIPAYAFSGINLTHQEWQLTHGAVKGSYDFTPTAIGEGVTYHDPTAVALYKKAAGVLPNTFQLAGWDALSLAIDAVKRAGTNSDREAFRNALATTKNFQLSTQGSVTWHNPPTGENITPSAKVLHVTGDSKFEILS
jgi:branched-chain amino acid transport system substrate-binding protein